MKTKFLGQNCFLFNCKNTFILSDPFYNMQKQKSGFDINAQKIDYILITHAHLDHVADVQEVLDFHPDVTIIAQPEICGYYKHKNIVDLNIGGTYNLDSIKITMVSASHTSSFADRTYGGVSVGYVLQLPNKNLYLAGDTSVIKDMELLTPLFGNIDCAVLPIGGHYTMDFYQASFAANELIKTKKVIGCHFDTFPPIEINHEEAYQAFEKHNIELILPEVGQEITF